MLSSRRISVQLFAWLVPVFLLAVGCTGGQPATDDNGSTSAPVAVELADSSIETSEQSLRAAERRVIVSTFTPDVSPLIRSGLERTASQHDAEFVEGDDALGVDPCSVDVVWIGPTAASWDVCDEVDDPASVTVLNEPLVRDELAVVVSRDSSYGDCISLGDLYALMSAEAEGELYNAEATAALAVQAGGFGLFPQPEPFPGGPFDGHSGYDLLIDAVIRPFADTRGSVVGTRNDIAAIPEDAVVATVANNPGIIAAVRPRQVEQGRDQVRVVDVAADQSEVCQNLDNPDAYPLSRSIWFQARIAPANESRQLVELANDLADLLLEQGYTPNPASLTAIEAATESS